MLLNAQLLAIIASSIHIFAYIIYNKDILRRKTHPNAASWVLWSFITLLNFTSYRAMTGDWIVSLLPTTTSLLCILTFFLAWRTGRFLKLDKFDIAILVFGIIAGIVWWISRSAVYANLILQGPIILSYVPTYRSVWKNPKNEKFLPWLIWSFVYALGTFVVILRWKGQWPALVNPIEGIIQCACIAILILRKK